MENKKIIYLKITLLLGLVFFPLVSCDRDLSDDATLSGFSTEGDIFTDTFVGMGSNFYLPFAGSKLDAFSVDQEVGYESFASYRVDVPNADDPTGNYAGAILRVDGAGRDLSGFDALTFWAKASQGVSVGEVGFGLDFIEDKYNVAANSISVGTNWAKYVVPIPDASKLVNERGVFWYAAGTQGTGGSGYILWFDDIKFERLGTIAQPRPAIANGNDITVDTFTGAQVTVTGLVETFNLGSGMDQTVAVAPSYYQFTSSNPSVATVSEFGIVSILGAGTSVITATLNGMDADGSVTINSLGDFQGAPIPTRDPSNVISIFSDAYNNVPVDFFNGFWEPFQTTLSADFVINGDNILNYTNFNFVGNQFANPTVDATNASNLHINMYIPGAIPPNLDFLISLVDFGPDQVDGGGDDTRQQVFFNSSDFVADTWSTLEIPITLANRNNMGLIIYENINGSTLSNFYLDNIYFYEIPAAPTEPTVAAPTPTDPAGNVISLFSDVYSDVNVDTWRTPWSAAATVFEDVVIAGNSTKKYTDLGFVGIETTSTTIDASAMTHFHLDVWSPDFSSFNIKLVDFGPDNAFGGGDDSEHEISITNPNQGEWVSLDIPLTDFTGLTAQSNIAQYILVGQPFEVTDVFIDNMYFHN